MDTPKDKISTEIIEKKKEYVERYKYWTTHALNILTFSINFFLTLSLFTIGLLINSDIFFSQISFTCCEIDLILTIKVLAILILALSFFLGGAAVYFRLYDARITRHISSSRYRFIKKENDYLCDNNLTEKNFSEIVEFIFSYKKNRISDEQLRMAHKALAEGKLSELRSISQALGKYTWIFHNWQIASFLFGFLFYIVSLIL